MGDLNTVHINNKTGDKVGDQYTVSKEKVGVLNTIHINKKMGDKVGDRPPSSRTGWGT